MKKILFPLFAVSVLVTSCADKNAYTVNGHVTAPGYDSTLVVLKTTNEDLSQKPETVDSTLILNGAFEFKGVAPTMNVQSLVFKQREGDRFARQVNIIAEPGVIDVTVDSVYNTIKGTPKNDELQAMNTKMRELNESKRTLLAKYKENPELETELDKQYEKLEAQEKAVLYDFVKTNINNSLGIFNFQRIGMMLPTDSIKDLLGSLTAEQKNYETVAAIQKYVDAVENTAVGKKFVDIKAKDPNGKDIALSDYAGKGKYVLVDFWASWCGPCRKEMPEVVKLYQKYKSKGFEIVGISLDRDEKSWQDGIKALNITWPQISDLKFWNSEGAKAYAVRSIPHTVLLDKDGTIIAHDLRGEELANKLAEIMK